MKKFILSAILIFSLSFLFAQADSNNLPGIATVVPFKLEVGYNYNTAIAFPGTVKKAYWGYKDIMAMNVPEVGNILLVKAVRKNFDSTNLHVFTLDGRLYVFDVTYSDHPMRTTFDLRKINLDSLQSAIQAISFTDQALNEIQLADAMQKARTFKPFLSKAKTEYGMGLRLRGIYFSHNLLFFSFELANFSNLDYDVDFMHLYIKDRKKSKRSSFQQRELVPVKSDTFKSVEGQNKKIFVVAVPKFTIPDKKEFFFEVYEVNGGRTLSLKIKNRQLLKAKPI